MGLSVGIDLELVTAMLTDGTAPVDYVAALRTTLALAPRLPGTGMFASVGTTGNMLLFVAIGDDDVPQVKHQDGQKDDNQKQIKEIEIICRKAHYNVPDYFLERWIDT